MLDKKDIRGFKKYRHIIANLIDYSYGYFTPKAALLAIQAHKKKEGYYCEWYMDMAAKSNPGVSWRNMTDQVYIDINKRTIKSSIRCRHWKSHKACLQIVDRNIKGNESLGASWF